MEKIINANLGDKIDSVTYVERDTDVLVLITTNEQSTISAVIQKEIFNKHKNLIAEFQSEAIGADIIRTIETEQYWRIEYRTVDFRDRYFAVEKVTTEEK